MGELSPEAQRLLDARKAASAELKQIDGQERPISDHDVVRLANARLYEQAITMRVLANEPISVGEFNAAHAMVESARSVAKGLPSIEIVYAEAIVGKGVCPYCHKAFEIDDYRSPPEPKRPPPVIEGEIVKTLPAPENAPATAPAPAKAKPFHESMPRTRPNAPASNGGAGSLCWFPG